MTPSQRPSLGDGAENMIYDARRSHSARERTVNRWIGGNKAIAGMQMWCTTPCRASALKPQRGET